MRLDETKISKMMKALDISREDAIELIQEDEEVDRMKSAKQINSDLSTEQKQNSKSARQTDRKATVYKFDTTKREKKANDAKRKLIGDIKTLLEGLGASVDIPNIEREIVFTYNDVKYKIVLSQPRT